MWLVMSPTLLRVLTLHAQDIRWDHEYQNKHGKTFRIPRNALHATRIRRATTRGFFTRGTV
jgi:hypothetical protein